MKEGQGFARLVTLENLKNFGPLLRRKTESDKKKAARKKKTEDESKADFDLASAKALFSGNPIKLRVSYKTAARRRKASTAPVSAASRGQLVWEKKDLPASDVQSQQGHPTGGLRLVQAEWKVNGRKIAHTTYFREVVFGKLEWTVGNYRPRKREAALVPFDVTILGESYGLRELVVSHKPSGEAGQRNYTTMLHWGELASTIKALNLVGKTFRLYAPPEGEEGPFVIEII